MSVLKPNWEEGIDIGVNHRIVGIKDDDDRGRKEFYDFVDWCGDEIEVVIREMFSDYKEWEEDEKSGKNDRELEKDLEYINNKNKESEVS